tara:strand:- start:813 stop:1355 length:543 start_codon:yes stop_codon:yes gene_type:complete
MDIEETIGKYFKLKHLIWSNTAKNNGLNNMPGIDGNPSQTLVINSLKNLMNMVIDPIVDKHPDLIITSGYRCKKLNQFLGGSSTSQHCFGQAIDIQVPNLSTAELYNYIYYNNAIKWDQLIWEYPEKGNGSWVHVSYSPYVNRRKTTLASDSIIYHDLYGGIRRGSKAQYQDGIIDAKIV